jgi:hypothetical protein
MTENPATLPSPALLQRYLHGVDYPASQEDLISHVQRECEGGNHPQSECERVMRVLSQLPKDEYRRPPDVSKAFGQVARRYLQGVSYPAQRDDLVASAREQGADEVVLDAIILIPDQDYQDVDAVIIEIVGGD